jgi:hypothetical protein
VLKNLFIFRVRANPEPKHFVRAAKHPNSAIVPANSNGNESIRRVDAFEVQAWMSRICPKEPVRGTSLISNILRKSGNSLRKSGLT